VLSGFQSSLSRGLSTGHFLLKFWPFFGGPGSREPTVLRGEDLDVVEAPRFVVNTLQARAEEVEVNVGIGVIYCDSAVNACRRVRPDPLMECQSATEQTR